MAVIFGIWLVLTVSTTNTAAFCVIGINKPNICFWPLKPKFIDTTNQHKSENVSSGGTILRPHY